MGSIIVFNSLGKYRGARLAVSNSHFQPSKKKKKETSSIFENKKKWKLGIISPFLIKKPRVGSKILRMKWMAEFWELHAVWEVFFMWRICNKYHLPNKQTFSRMNFRQKCQIKTRNKEIKVQGVCLPGQILHLKLSC